MNEKWIPIHQLFSHNTSFSDTFGIIKQDGELCVVNLTDGVHELTSTLSQHDNIAFAVAYEKNEIAIVDEHGVRLINVLTNEEIINIGLANVFAINALVDSLCVMSIDNNVLRYVAIHHGDWGEICCTTLREFSNGVKLSECVCSVEDMRIYIDNYGTPLDNLSTSALTNANITYGKFGELRVNDKKVNAIAYMENGPVAIVNDDGTKIFYSDSCVETDEHNVFKLMAALSRRQCLRRVANQLSLMATSNGMRLGVFDGENLIANGEPVNNGATLLNEYMPVCSASMRALTETAVIDLEQNKYTFDYSKFLRSSTIRFTPALIDKNNGDLYALAVDVDCQVIQKDQPLITCKCSLLNVHEGSQQVIVDNYCYFADYHTLQGRIMENGDGVLLYVSDVRWALDDNGGWTGTTLVDGHQAKITDYIADFNPDENNRFVATVDDPRRGTCWTTVIINEHNMYANSFPLDTVDVVLFGNTPMALRATTAGTLIVSNIDKLIDKTVDVQNVHPVWMLGLTTGVLLRTDDGRVLWVTTNARAQIVTGDDALMTTKPLITPDGELFAANNDTVTPLMLVDNELQCATGAKFYVAPTNPVVGVVRGENGVYALTRTPAHVIMLEKLTPGGVC